MGRFDGKVVLVTGAARGQGEPEARLFASEGASVVLADVLDAEGEAGFLRAVAMRSQVNPNGNGWNEQPKKSDRLGALVASKQEERHGRRQHHESATNEHHRCEGIAIRNRGVL